MSLFNWFPGKKKSAARKSSPASRPPSVSPRKGLRLKRRELLFAVVRESMIRGGVLSTSYEFKVLTLDATGDTFLVLIDLALPTQSLQDEHLAEVESWIRDSAAGRHNMTVRSVYWRRKSVQDPQRLAPKTGAQTERQPTNSAPMPLPSAKSPQAPRPYQAVDLDEIEAFRRAMRHAPRPTGVITSEDVRLPTPESHSDFSALSETQYGKL